MQIPLFFPIMKFRRIILREKIKVIHTLCINGENTIMDERYSQFKINNKAAYHYFELCFQI